VPVSAFDFALDFVGFKPNVILEVQHGEIAESVMPVPASKHEHELLVHAGSVPEPEFELGKDFKVVLYVLRLQKRVLSTLWFQNKTNLFLPLFVDCIVFENVSKDVGLVPSSINENSVLVEHEGVVSSRGRRFVVLPLLCCCGAPSITLDVEQRKIVEIGAALASVAPKEIYLAIMTYTVAATPCGRFLLSLAVRVATNKLPDLCFCK
jgi:hypothetical protein